LFLNPPSHIIINAAPYLFGTIVSMKELYELEKTLWTETDFEIMSWHDCPIHALAFDKEDKLLLDIDYIFI
jgi:hypothetical protein